MTEREILNKSIADHEKAIADAKAGLKSLDVTYSIGDRFKSNSNKYMLVSDDGMVGLVCLRNGEVNKSFVEVSNRHRITTEECKQTHFGCITRYWDDRKHQKC